ncbi:hypothetical protein AB0H37_08850 [Actinomadura sp. NPDC023710]|uniref:hypothetical protein n=1 Tax=Actinomadura sp. NPDC023710 TaxID=3158219 RepID=UPI0033D04B4E
MCLVTVYLADVAPLRPDLPWKPLTIPGSGPPVELVRLEIDPADGSSTSLVRFPPGWRRPGAGHYLCGEEFVVLEGRLTVSGVAYGPGERGWIRSAVTRRDSRSEAGALALAWFSGVPAWVDGDTGTPPEPSGGRTRLLTVPVPDAGLLLRSGSAGETRLYEQAPASFAAAARVLWPAGPGGPRWTALRPGEPVPSGRTGRAFVRIGHSHEREAVAGCPPEPIT